jgi:hypothetical protein
MPTIDVAIAATVDDGTGADDAELFNFLSTVGNIDDQVCDLFLRFDGVTIPSDAVVTAAVITMHSDAGHAAGTKALWYGVLAADPAAPTNIAGFLALDTTVASVAQTFGAAAEDADFASADLAILVQEIVDGVSREAEAAMLFIARDDGSPVDNLVTAHDYVDGVAGVATLHIEYTVASTGGGHGQTTTRSSRRRRHIGIILPPGFRGTVSWR